MSYQPATTSKPTYHPLPFSTQLDEVDKALFEYRYRKQHTGFSHQQKQQTQQHFNVNNNNMKYHNNGKHNRGNNYQHGNKQHNQANYNNYNNYNNASYYGNGIPINTAVATASVAQPVRQQQQQTVFNSTSPTLYQPTNNNGYFFNSNANVNVNTASKLNEFEEAFPLNSRLADNVNLSSSVSSGSNSSYSSFNDGDFIFNNGKNINGGNGSLGGVSGFGGLGGSAGFGSGFNDLNFGAQRANGEKSFGFLNIWGNDMSVWS